MTNSNDSLRTARRHLNLAPFANSHWIDALHALTAATGCRAGQMMGWNGPNNVPFELMTDLSKEDMRFWLDVGGADPARNPIIKTGSSVPVMRDVTDVEIIGHDERRMNPLWGEFYDPLDIPHICFVPLWRDGDAHLVLCALSSARQGPIGEGDRARFRLLARDWRDAAALSRALGTEGTRILAGALDAVSIAAIVVNGFGFAVALTQLAEKIIRKGNHLRLKHGVLSTCSPVDDTALHGAIRRVLLSERQAAQCLSIRDKDGLPTAIKVAPLPRDHADIGFGARALIVVDELPPRSPAVLALRFGLTKAEAEIATMLADGERMEEIAIRRGVSEETVRTQAKAVYQKTRVRGQVGLMARLRW